MDIKTLSLDLETKSGADIGKTGVYRYAEDPDFDILLFAVSVNSGPVNVYDLACGETVPDEILAALTDNGVIKSAYNASFERVCLSYWLRRYYPQHFRSYGREDDSAHSYLDPASWRCSLVWAAYNGLPLGLEKVGAVLGLEQQKMKEGKDLIRYFCCPCKPTASNGGRTWNLPQHAPEKWELFKKYNIRDVEVELQIQERLKNYPVPDTVWEEYRLDQEINDRGIMIDREMVEQALRIDEISHSDLTARMHQMTGLDNPNSVSQMKDYLAENGLETESLGKKDVKALIQSAPEDLAEVLSLRLQLAKSSVKKYEAMQNAVCADGRCRGMFQFYGANRSGRWCLTGDHEVLSPDGWIRLDEWQGGNIACWNSTSEAVSFQPAQQVSFLYTGPMYTYEDARIDQCSTPDHKMYAQKRYGDEWQAMTVEQMSHCRPCIPISGYRYHRGCANPAWLRVLIMTQADGHYTADGSVRFHFKKRRKIERCKQLLRRAEIAFVEHDYKDVTSITVPARAVPLWLREFRTKTFGFWLLDENPDIFFDELPNWDGYYPAPNSIQYSTCNKQNADIVQALAHMSGRTAVMRKKCRGEDDRWSDAYIVDIWLAPKNCHEIRRKPEVSDFSGTVYCASTPTGYFLVRRNGKVWVTGNSGRLVQLQNLPQNHLPDLDQARELVRQGDYEMLNILYDSVPGVLSELIRTAFIPKSGHQFIVSDFSAIEARVLSYLAGEKWRIDLFKNGGDIYCQSASEMFKVPVEKHGQNAHLRQKGKIAELACIAEGQLVLTDHGEKPIETVTTDDLLWDGESWVQHEGIIYKGIREIITYEGLTATPDHLVWVEGKSEPVQLGVASASGAHLVRTGTISEQDRPITATAKVYDIMGAGKHHRFTVSGRLVHNCGYGGSVGALKAMGAIEMGLSEDELQPLVSMWRESNPHIVQYWWAIDTAVKETIQTHAETKVGCISFQARNGMLFISLPSGRRLAYVKPRIGINKFGGESVTYMGIDAQKKWSRIESYGPKFVENIVQAVSRDILAYAMKSLSNCFIVGHVHDELIIECPAGTPLEQICEAMGQTPPWLPGIDLRADGYCCKYYKKD